MAEALTLPGATPKPLSLGEWQPPTAPASSIVAAAKAEEENLLGPIETTPLSIADYNGLLANSAAKGEDVAEAYTGLRNLAEKQAEIDKLRAKGASLTAVDILNANDPYTTANAFRYDVRAAQAQERLMAILEQFSGGSVDSVMETIDSLWYETIMGSNPFDMPTKAAGGGTHETWRSEEWLNAISNFDDQQWEEFLANKEKGLLDPGLMGLVTGYENRDVVARELRALETAGYVPWDQEQGFLDVGLSVLPNLGVAAKAGAKGFKALSGINKSVVFKARSMLGTKASTEVAETVLEEGVATTAKVADDVLPSAFVNNVVDVPPVSQGELISNRFLKEATKRYEAGSFGHMNLTDDAATWAATRGKAIARAASTPTINFDIITSVAKRTDIVTPNSVTAGGFDEVVAVHTIGKDGGAPWKNFNNVKKEASKFENSEVISLKTGKVVTKGTKGDEYAIRTTERVSFDAPVLDVKALKDRGPVREGFARWLGSSGLNSNPIHSDIMFQSDAGGAKFKNYLQDTYAKDFNKLDTQSQGTLSAIINGIRDDKATSWLSTTDFITQFTAMAGKAPSKEAVQLYSDTVQLADFSWAVQADLRLKDFAQQGVLVYKGKKNTRLLVKPLDKNFNRATIGKIYNGSTGATEDASKVDPSQIIYKFVEGKSGRPRYVYNTVGKTEVPTHADAYPYNSGGGRSNPEIGYFIGTVGDTWNTALGAKTAKQAKAAVEEINTVRKQAEDLKINWDDPLNGLSPADETLLDNAVLANNKWNPNIESFREFVEFMDARGVPLRLPVISKERGAKIETLIDFNDSYLVNKDLGSFISYSRHSEHLIEYGGSKTWNPNPVQAIVMQANRVTDQIARIQYMHTAVESWAKTVLKALKAKEGAFGELLETNSLSGGFTGATLARNLEIKGDTALARKLRREQSVIVRRLNVLEGSSSESPLWGTVRNSTSSATNWLMEMAYDSEWAFLKNKATPLLRELRDNTSGNLLSATFLAIMATPFQVVLQGTAALQISARSPKNGFKAAVLASYVRSMAAHKQGPQLVQALRKNLAKVAGLPDDKMDELMKHFETSGRGFIKGAVIEDPDALPGIGTGNVVTRTLTKAADIAREPFYIGENYAQTVSRIAAYLDTVDAFPAMPIDSRAFWGEVIRRDRSLSMNLNKSSASMLQSDNTTRVISQFSSFQFRVFETVFFDDALTLGERVRLAASLTVFWGWAGMGLPNEWFGDQGEQNSMLKELLKYGPLDFVLKNTMDFTLGDRIGMNLPALVSRASLVAQGNLAEVTPTVSVATSASKAIVSGFGNLVGGRPMLAAYDLGTLVRTFKIVDDTYMAYTMMVQQERVSKTGISLPAEYTTFSAFMQALGVRPEAAIKFTHLSNGLFRAKDRKRKAVEKSVPSIKMAIKYYEEGNEESAAYYMNEAAAIIDAYDLGPIYRADAVKQAITEAGESKVEQVILGAIRAGLGDQAMDVFGELK
jgi:hypothetical protein